MRLDAVDLEQHPEAAAVDGACDAGLLAEPLQRPARHERHRAAADPAVYRAALRPEEPQRLAGVFGQRFLPRANHGSRGVRPAVQRRLHRVAQLYEPLETPAVGELEDEPARRLVPLDAHAQELRPALVVDEPAALVDEPEAAVTGDACGPELHLVRIDEVQRLHRGDRDSRDAACHALNLAARRDAAERPE